MFDLSTKIRIIIEMTLICIKNITVCVHKIRFFFGSVGFRHTFAPVLATKNINIK